MFLQLCCQAVVAATLRSFHVNSAGTRVTEWKSAPWDAYQWELFTVCSLESATVSHPSCLFPWQPSLFPLRPSTCKRSRPSGKSPQRPQNATCKVSACRWGWPKHHVHLEEVAPSCTSKGEAESTHPLTARICHLSKKINPDMCPSVDWAQIFAARRISSMQLN